MSVVARLRRLFDLDARPAAIAAHLARDRRLARARARPPGAARGRRLRSVRGGRPRGARTAGERGGRGNASPRGSPTAWARRSPRRTRSLTRLFPDADAVAGGDRARSGGAGRPRQPRARRCARSPARSRAVSSPSTPRASRRELVEQMVALPGVGPWTAHCLAMRGLGWPDAFPEDDLVLRQALGGISGRAGARPRRALAPLAGLRRHSSLDRARHPAGSQRAPDSTRSSNQSAGASQP